MSVVVIFYVLMSMDGYWRWLAIAGLLWCIHYILTYSIFVVLVHFSSYFLGKYTILVQTRSASFFYQFLIHAFIIISKKDQKSSPAQKSWLHEDEHRWSFWHVGIAPIEFMKQHVIIAFLSMPTMFKSATGAKIQKVPLSHWYTLYALLCICLQDETRCFKFLTLLNNIASSSVKRSSPHS